MKKKIAGESSAQIRKRVEAVQEIHRKNKKKENKKGVFLNGTLLCVL